MTPKQIARKTGLSLSTVYRKFPVHKPRATPVDVRVLINVGVPKHDIAYLLSVSPTTVERLAVR